MYKVLNKINFQSNKNRMKSIANTKVAIDYFNSFKSKNLKFLLKQRFEWMNNFIENEHKGLEVGSGAGFAKFFIANKMTPCKKNRNCVMIFRFPLCW